MGLEVAFSKNQRRLTVKHSQPGKPVEIIVMEAHSGGWFAHRPLPTGQWLIVENPRGYRSYFGLFYQDNKVNDQFKHDKEWRDGIRFGFHSATGSHGCIMARPTAGQSYIDAQNAWARIQALIRTQRPRKVITYQNNENPSLLDNTKYCIMSYGHMAVSD